MAQSSAIRKVPIPAGFVAKHGDRARPVVEETPPPNFAPRVHGYQVLEEVGSGGMGVVYRALHRDLNRIVALKMLRASALTDPESLIRFRAEAEAVARLQHPNIIQVFEIGEDSESSPFIALEFVDGGSLSQQTSAPKPPRWAAELVEKLARAVHSAHLLGVVHRDLKPANVLMTRGGEPKIADFGLAKRLGAKRVPVVRSLTQTGVAVGTPEYMPPEQIAGSPAAVTVDVWSLGVMLYELLAGRVPFRGESLIDTLNLVHQADPVPPRRFRPELHRDLETICQKCLEKNPARRYATARALADDLRRFLDGRTILARRTGPVEKAVRLARRNPLAAASLAAVTGITLIALVVVTSSNLQLEEAVKNEAEQRREAERNEDAERRERYLANITATASLFEANDATAARRTLHASPPLHRNWEWRHFDSRIDLSSRSVVAERVTGMQRVFVGNGAKLYFCEPDELVVLDVSSAQFTRKTRPTSTGLRRSTISRDGRRLAYRIGTDAIEVWEPGTNRTIRFAHGHASEVRNLEFSADAARLFTVANDGWLCVWDAATGKAVCQIDTKDESIQATRVSANGSLALTWSLGSQSIRVWNTDTGKLHAELPCGKTGFFGGQFSPSGRRLITFESFPATELKLWDATTGRLIREMPGHTNSAIGIVFAPDETRVATCSMDQTVRLWNLETGDPIALLRGHTGWVNAVVFSPDGKRLVSCSRDHTVRLWNGETGAEINVLPGHVSEVHELAYSPDGSRIVSVSKDQEVRFWDPQRVERDGVLRGHTSFVYGVACHPDGRRLASAAWDGTVRIWDAVEERQLASFDHGEHSIVTSVAFHPGRKLLASRTLSAVHLWDLETGREVRRWNSPSDPWRHTRLAFSPDGSLLATGGAEKTVLLFKMESQEEPAVLRGHTDVVRDVAFSPDGRWLASAGETADKTVRIWSVAEQRTVQVLQGHSDCVYSLAFNAAGTVLASGSCDGTARLWNTADWEPQAVLDHASSVYGLAFSPDGTRLVAACANNKIRLWDTASQKEVVDLRGHTKYVHAVAFSADGNQLVSGSGDGTVRVWNSVRMQNR